jgi:hypothetical protein
MNENTIRISLEQNLFLDFVQKISLKLTIIFFQKKLI